VSESASNEKLGERTRVLMRAISSFADMVAVGAPTPMLARQLDELEAIFIEIDQLAGTNMYENLDFGDMGQLMKLYELFQFRQAQKPGSE
jgi:hypothetical protein